ncbi:hypothetical protein F511_45337 [Dorcoceras hygrometricum]|uniref:Uncharacterized protein n=1 Tax=Dorcoceras hygrometricum TaxID=472368 RepID=A0A2Z6ZW51_9LAMI|nr:hypothetical protein F511_45337 [Dorcoceras hygrometricum]
MSLFDLQDVRIAIRSIATLDLPMVVDLIGIYGLKGPYQQVAAPSSLNKPPPPPPPSAAVVAAWSCRNLFRPTRRGESVRADLVRPSSAG